MKSYFLYILILPLLLLIACGSGDRAIIADQTSVDIESIPEKYIEAAKELRIHYAHTSHGSQVISGLNYLETYIDPVRYSVTVREEDTEGLPLAEDPPALRIYDGNPPETYIEPNDYWDGDSALDRTRAVCATGNYDISLWSWCGQQSTNSVETVEAYLEAMSTLEEEFPDMIFIYMTGHTDDSSQSYAETLKRNNDIVREYCRENNKVLYDFAMIESYDPDGNYDTDPDDACNWCADWCSGHPNQCTNLPSCSHSHGLNCVLKGKAFWHLMARIAGWKE